MKTNAFSAALALALASAMASNIAIAQTPAEIVEAAPASAWREIASDDLVIMTLAPDAAGQPREVAIQLFPEPWSSAWTANVRALAKAHWWDGMTVYRSVDNWVVQWGEGDVAEPKALPAAMRATAPEGYALPWRTGLVATLWSVDGRRAAEMPAKVKTAPGSRFADPYAAAFGYVNGLPVASDLETRNGLSAPGRIWPVHCYASVGVARGLTPDAGNGAELYTVIGHAPRQLDRNIAVVGRIVAGIEHLSILPRGTAEAGVNATAAERTPIASVRLASELPEAERPRFRVLDTDGDTFARWVEAKANRKDTFYSVPAGGADVCNLPVPVQPVRD
ncbi:peptidylprolyl isomerase [Croceicoccus sp. BE223]|uniref:peptidylprolyl isomerase n=1 Tax=Croceicoccus sp. BE223 TaxID=2817716 RepID=UPI002855BD2B|nr:peptidylprolyl isomerase [Croceicoccus sp. BE223]MDR7102940.1 peptidylprolyl isomerase [Croceicoccus sp. BE223]